MEEHSLYYYWLILYRRRTMIYVVTACAVVFAAWLSWWLPNVYEAYSVFFVPSRADALTFFANTGPAQVTRTPLVPEARGEQQKIYLGILDSETLRQRVQREFPTKPLRQLMRDVDVKAGTDFLLRVYVRDRDSSVAARIANAYVRNFNELMNSYSHRNMRENLTAAARQLGETETKLAAARSELADFQARKKIAMITEESSSLTKVRSDLTKEARETDVKLSELDTKLGQLSEQYAKETGMYMESPAAMTSPLAEALEKQLSDLASQIEGARATLTDRHPAVVGLMAQHETKKRELAEEIARLTKSKIKAPGLFVENLRRDMVSLLVDKETARARAGGLARAIAQVEARIVDLPRIQSTHNELTRRVDDYQKLIESLQTMREEAVAQERRDLMNIVIVDDATAPDKPVFPNMILNVLVALGLGLVGGTFYAYFTDYLDQLKLNLEAGIRELEKDYA